MSVVSSLSMLIYAAAAVALLVFVLECCCRTRIKRFREGTILVCAVNESNRNQYPAPQVGVVGPLPTRVPYPRAPCPGPPPPPPPPPLEPLGAGGLVGTYPHAPAPNLHVDEAPPPTYEQAMATERARTHQPR